MKNILMSTVAACCLASFAHAEVELSSKDGSIRIQGELLNFENNVYVLRTNLGEFRIESEKVVCTGAECPTPDAGIAAPVSIASSAAFNNTMLPSIISKIAAANSANVQPLPPTSDGKTSEYLVAENGKIVTTLEKSELDADDAFKALFDGEVDMIFVERRATNAEVELFLENGLGDLTSLDRETIFGQDALSVVVSPSNPVQTITLAEAEAIFSGAINNWNELGGEDRPITLLAPADDSALADLFTTSVLDANFSSFASSAERSLSLAEIEQRVAADAGAIGIVSSANIQSATPTDIELSCGMLAPLNSFSVRAETYPLVRRLYAYTTNRTEHPIVGDIIDILQSPEGAEIVEASGFVSLRAETSDLNAIGERLAYALSDPTQEVELPNLRAFAGEVFGAERLSTTFRFSTGSSQIDNKARADIARLVDLLQQPQYQNKEVLLVGFTDSIGKSVVNTVLSQRRATQVKDAIGEGSGGQIDAGRVRTLGFGASMPAACNNEDLGREINRRVEVWLR